MATLVMALGAMRAPGGDFLGGLWFVLIGVFLRQASQTSVQQLLIRRALEPLAVRDVMARDVVQIAGDTTVARAVDEVFWRHHFTSVPVVAAGQVVGIFGIKQLAELPRDRWSDTEVSDVMQRIAPSLTAAPRDDLWTAFQKLSTNGLGRLAVVEHDRLAGYLVRKTSCTC